MSFIIKDNPVIVNIKLTNEGRKKLASGNFNVTKFAVGDSEINYKYYNEVNFNKNNSIVLSPKEGIKDIKYKIKKYYNTEENIYNITPLSEKREIKIDLNTGFFRGNSIYKMEADLNSAITKISNLKIDLGDVNSATPKTLRIKQDEYFIFLREPELGDYILVNWSNIYNNTNNFKNGIIDYNIYSPFIWYKITSINGNIENDTLSVGVDKDLPGFGTLIGETYFSYCAIYPKFNSILNFYGTQNLSDFWDNRSDNDYIENMLENTLITPVFNLTIFYPEKNIGFLNNYISPNNLQSYQYAGFFKYISEYKKNKNHIYGLIHYTNTTPHNTLGESFYENSAEILLPTIMWYKNKDNKMGLGLKCDDSLNRLTDYNLYYYNIIDDNNFIVGKCFHELKIFLIEDQEILTALNFKSNRNWTLPPSILTLNTIVCPTTTTTTIEPTTTTTTTTIEPTTTTTTTIEPTTTTTTTTIEPTTTTTTTIEPTTTTTTTIEPTTTTTTTIEPTTTTTTTIEPTTTTTTTIEPTTTTTTTIEPTTTTTTTTIEPSFSGDCRTYQLSADGSTATSYEYYEHPSGDLIQVTLQVSESTTVNAYESPGIIVISGDGFYSDLGLCSEQTTTTTTIIV
jgi:hypothetical protein